jgi:hypothetical protein
MRLPQVVVFESDGRLAASLQPLAERRVWSLREPRQVDSCLRLLPAGEPCVLVVRLGRDLEREMGLLERARRAAPDTAVVLVGDVDHPGLAGLGWDLGASAVLMPGSPREALLEVVSALMGEPSLPEEG